MSSNTRAPKKRSKLGMVVLFLAGSLLYLELLTQPACDGGPGNSPVDASADANGGNPIDASLDAMMMPTGDWGGDCNLNYTSTGAYLNASCAYYTANGPAQKTAIEKLKTLEHDLAGANLPMGCSAKPVPTMPDPNLPMGGTDMGMLGVQSGPTVLLPMMQTNFFYNGYKQNFMAMTPQTVHISGSAVFGMTDLPATLPALPVITSPMADAMVPRTSPLVVTWTPFPSDVFTIQVGANASSVCRFDSQTGTGTIAPMYIPQGGNPQVQIVSRAGLVTENAVTANSMPGVMTSFRFVSTNTTIILTGG